MIVIPIAPRQKGRHKSRVVTVGGRSFAQHYAEKESARWEDRVAYYLAELAPRTFISSGPIRMRVLFLMRRPTRLMRKKDHDGIIDGHDRRPDLSNLLKAIEDAANEVLFKDDSQIAEIVTAKAYAEKGGQPRIVIELESMEHQEITVDSWFNHQRAG